MARSVSVRPRISVPSQSFYPGIFQVLNFVAIYGRRPMALRSIVRTLLVTLFAWSLLPAAAQTGDTKPAKVEVFTGYSWMNAGSTVNGFEDGAPSTLHLKDARGGFL